MIEHKSAGRILVTGGTGFIGVYLCRHLQALGYQLTVLTRQPQRAAVLLGGSVSCVKHISMLPDHEYFAIINLAGEPLAQRWSKTRKSVFRASRIDLTRALYEHFKTRTFYPQVLISGSAIGFYGDCGARVVSEGGPPGLGFAADLCRDWEAAAQLFSGLGTRVCLLRTGIVLGEGGGMLARMLPAFRMGAGGRLGSGEQWMSWIQREDLVRLISHCLAQQQLTGPVNGVAPQPVTNGEFTRALGQVLHRPTRLPMPRWLLRTLFGEMADALMLASQRVVPEVASHQDFVFHYPNLEAALRASIKK